MWIAQQQPFPSVEGKKFGSFAANAKGLR